MLLVVLLSAGIDNFVEKHDVQLRKGDGGTDQDCMAQADIVFPMLKDDLAASRHKGQLMLDTVNQIRAKIGGCIGLNAANAAESQMPG